MSQFGLIFTKQKLVSVTEFDFISSAHVNVTHQVQLPIRKLLCRTKEVKRTNSVGEGLPASRKMSGCVSLLMVIISVCGVNSYNTVVSTDS